MHHLVERLVFGCQRERSVKRDVREYGCEGGVQRASGPTLTRDDGSIIIAGHVEAKNVSGCLTAVQTFNDTILVSCQ